MFIWNVDVETTWSYHDIDDCGDDENYIVAAETFEMACEKAKKLALAKSRKYVDEENGKTERPISVDFVNVERKDWIDG